MRLFSFGVASLVVIAIVGIGLAYLIRPQAISRTFGLPPPAAADGARWWLRLKGSRDVVSGLVLLAVMLRGTPQLVGVVLMVAALTPLADMTTIVAARGSTGAALGVHGVTAAVMIAAALPLLFGVS